MPEKRFSVNQQITCQHNQKENPECGGSENERLILIISEYLPDKRFCHTCLLCSSGLFVLRRFILYRKCFIICDINSGILVDVFKHRVCKHLRECVSSGIRKMNIISLGQRRLPPGPFYNRGFASHSFIRIPECCSRLVSRFPLCIYYSRNISVRGYAVTLNGRHIGDTYYQHGCLRRNLFQQG